MPGNSLSPYMRKQGYHRLLDLQADRANPKCMICGVDEPTNGKALAVDHCHNTGRFRGLLCVSCNAGVGMFKDTPSLLVAAASYLMAHTDRTEQGITTPGQNLRVDKPRPNECAPSARTR